MTVEEKGQFIKSDLFLLLNKLEENTSPAWGKMDARQMLEHLNDFFEVSIEKKIFPLCVPEEHLPKYREFVYSDKAFRENTKAPETVLGDVPLPWRTSSLADARTQLEASVAEFFHYFNAAPGKRTVHPVFGSLDHQEWIMLHHKHVIHHLKQFNLR